MATSIDYNFVISTGLLEASSEIPTDITYSVFEQKQEDSPFFCAGEVKAHKFVLALASPVFSTSFYGMVNTEQETSKQEIKMTTLEAFQKMVDFIYMKPLQLEATSLPCIFFLADLAERYTLPQLRNCLVQHLEALPLTRASAMMAAVTTSKFQHLKGLADPLLQCCARAIHKSLAGSALAIFNFAAELVGTGQEVVGMQLLARMKELDDFCSNCGVTPCCNGQPMLELQQFTKGTWVKANPASPYMVGAVYLGAGTIYARNSRSGKVKIVSGDGTQWLSGRKFLVAPMDSPPSFRFACFTEGERA